MLAFHSQFFDRILRGLHFGIIAVKPAEVHRKLRGDGFINLNVIRATP
jgi:hypothetical protein